MREIAILRLYGHAPVSAFTCALTPTSLALSPHLYFALTLPSLSTAI